MERINFDLVLSELMKGLRDVSEFDEIFSNDFPYYLLEGRTISIKSPRQTGKTTFVQEHVNRGNSIAVVGISENNGLYTQFQTKIKPEYNKNVYTVYTLLKNQLELNPSEFKFIFIDDYVNLPDKFWKMIQTCFPKDIIIVKMG